MDDREIETALLKKFVKKNIWGKYHIREDTMLKGFPGHLGHKIKIAAENLRKRGYLVKYPTNHGMQWHLNRNMIKEINDLLSKNETIRT